MNYNYRYGVTKRITLIISDHHNVYIYIYSEHFGTCSLLASPIATAPKSYTAEKLRTITTLQTSQLPENNVHKPTPKFKELHAVLAKCRNFIFPAPHVVITCDNYLVMPRTSISSFASGFFRKILDG